MRKITVFDHVSLDGFFCGPNGEMDFFKFILKDDEYATFTHGNAKGGGVLMFGHTTYDIMKAYWPTDMAKKVDPLMAEVMHMSKKIVVSATITDEQKGAWQDTVVLRKLDHQEIQKLKEEDGPDIVVLGSGSVVQQLTNLGMIDSYTLVIVPVILGKGKPLFEGVQQTALALKEAKSYKNGVVVATYEVA